MASTTYDSFTYDHATDAVELSTDTFYVMLVSGYTPNSTTHTRRSDVTGEITGTGYTAGGQALAGITFTLDTTTHKTIVKSTNPSWPTSTIAATGSVVYKRRGGLATADELVSFTDFGGTVTSTAAAFTITSFATAGFLTINKV
jgi:hypothetical protein